MASEAEIKRRVRERDGYRCTDCGVTNDQHVALTGRALQVHRVVPGSDYSEKPGVCVTLCKACHGPKPRRQRSECPNSRIINLDAEWVNVLRRLAKKSGRPISWHLAVLLKAEAEREGLTDLPVLPWVKQMRKREAAAGS
jgi:hypothetical protein